MRYEGTEGGELVEEREGKGEWGWMGMEIRKRVGRTYGCRLGLEEEGGVMQPGL